MVWWLEHIPRQHGNNNIRGSVCAQKQTYRQQHGLLLGLLGLPRRRRVVGLGLLVIVVVVVAVVEDELGAEGAVAHADGGLGQPHLLEALGRHVLGLVLGEPVVAHAAGLDADDGICFVCC